MQDKPCNIMGKQRRKEKELPLWWRIEKAFIHSLSNRIQAVMYKQWIADSPTHSRKLIFPSGLERLGWQHQIPMDQSPRSPPQVLRERPARKKFSKSCAAMTKGMLVKLFQLMKYFVYSLMQLEEQSYEVAKGNMTFFRWKIWKLCTLNNFPRAILSVRTTLGPGTLTHHLWVLLLSNRFLSFQTEVSVL